jgi:chromosome segregation ATPase
MEATTGELSERAVRALSAVQELGTVMASLRDAMLARPERAAVDDPGRHSQAGGEVGARLADLAREVAAFDREVRGELEQLESEVDAAVAALRALQDRAGQRHHGASEGATEIGASLDQLRVRMEEVQGRLEATASEATQASHDVARSAEEGRGALRHHVEALHRAADEAGEHGAETATRTRRHSSEVGDALEQELGSVGRNVGVMLERLQHELEAAVAEQVRGVVREGIERLRALIRELLEQMGGDRDDLQSVREVLSSLFDRLQSLLSPLEAEAAEVQVVHDELEQRRREREENDDHG